MSLSRTADNYYSIRLVRLLQKDFTKWKAYNLGIIDHLGNVIKKPNSAAEKDSWTKFHVVVRNIKRAAGYIPGASLFLRLGGSYLLLREIQQQYGLSDEFPQIVESVLAGDSGGDVNSIATGQTSGAITSPGPSAKKHKKFKEFNTDQRAS